MVFYLLSRHRTEWSESVVRLWLRLPLWGSWYCFCCRYCFSHRWWVNKISLEDTADFTIIAARQVLSRSIIPILVPSFNSSLESPIIAGGFLHWFIIHLRTQRFRWSSGAKFILSLTSVNADCFSDQKLQNDDFYEHSTWRKRSKIEASDPKMLRKLSLLK